MRWTWKTRSGRKRCQPRELAVESGLPEEVILQTKTNGLQEVKQPSLWIPSLQAENDCLRQNQAIMEVSLEEAEPELAGPGAAMKFLGIEIERSEKGVFRLHQRSYVQELLRHQVAPRRACKVAGLGDC